MSSIARAFGPMVTRRASRSSSQGPVVEVDRRRLAHIVTELFYKAGGIVCKYLRVMRRARHRDIGKATVD
jgi:hypothetical protein